MGEFMEGLMHGAGILVFQQGASYEGQFQNDLPHGYGIEHYSSGAMYQGQFQKDLRHGFGIYTFVSGVSYGGMWETGLQHGEGVEVNIFSPVDPIRPNSPLLKSLNVLSSSQNEFMRAGERAMEKARRMVQDGDTQGSKNSVKESIKWMKKAAAASEEIRASLHNQQSTGRTLVKYLRGSKIQKKVEDPNAIATKIITGGWIELAVEAGTTSAEQHPKVSGENSGPALSPEGNHLLTEPWQLESQDLSGSPFTIGLEGEDRSQEGEVAPALCSGWQTFGRVQRILLRVWSSFGGHSASRFAC